MTIAVYYTPNITLEQYREIDRRLTAATGENPPEDLLHHSCFGEEDNVEVFEIWTSREAFERDSQRNLLPIFEAMDLEIDLPAVAEVHALMQSASSLASAE